MKVSSEIKTDNFGYVHTIIRTEKNEQFDLKMGKMSEQTAQRKHTDKQISIGDGKSERQHSRNQ